MSTTPEKHPANWPDVWIKFGDSFWKMVQAVLVASIRKGVLPLAVVGLCVIIWFVRVSPSALESLPHQIAAVLRDYKIGGWIVATLAISGWIYHANWQRRVIAAEMRRMGQGKSALQEKKIGRKLGSSD